MERNALGAELVSITGRVLIIISDEANKVGSILRSIRDEFHLGELEGPLGE